MSLITIINLFLSAGLLVVIGFGVWLNFKYTEKSIYRKYLLSMLLLWGVVMLLMVVKFFVDGNSQISFNRESASMMILLLGIPCFFALVSYPVVILNAKFKSLKQWLIETIPIILSVVVYFAYHLFAGVDSFTSYATTQELFRNISDPSVALRLLIVLLFIIYVVRSLVAIWVIVPIYDRYIRDNVSNSNYNVEWIRPLVIYSLIVSVFYFTLLFKPSIYLNCCYMLSIFVLFSYIVEMSLFRGSSDCVEPLFVKRKPWRLFQYTIDEKHDHKRDPSSSKSEFYTFAKELDSWMTEQQPYSHVEFTIKDILEKFPEMTNYDLQSFFKSIEQTFQSYVRIYRIRRACEIIIESDDKIYSKQVFSAVGFSHHSSFSRSFMAVVGMSPSDYIKLDKEAQQGLKPDLQPLTPPPIPEKDLDSTAKRVIKLG